MNNRQFRGNEYRTTIVCVDSYDDGVMAGRFYNPGCTQGRAFPSLSRFLVEMEAFLNEMQILQSFTEPRAFGPPRTEEPEDAPDNAARTGKCATFAVRILFRQNASWQGSVAWLEGKQEESFRSVLELILLMDSALRSA